MNLNKKLKVIVRERRLRLPFLNISKPRFRLTLPHLNVLSFQKRTKLVIAGAMGVSSVVVAGAIFFSIVGITDAKVWPEPGAEYALPRQEGELLPPYYIDTPQQEENQTLQVTLADGARISSLTFSNMELGKTGLATCFQIARDVNNSAGYLYVDSFTMKNTSAPSFNMADSMTASLTLAGLVDGHTNSSTLDSTITEQIVLSSRGAGTFLSEGSTVDRIIVMLNGSATVGTMLVDGVKCSVGGIDLDHVKAGSMSFEASNRVGSGSGIDSADFVVQQSVKYRTSTDSLIDTPITVR